MADIDNRFELLEDLPLGLALVDPDGRTVWINQAARSLLGTDNVARASFRQEGTGESYPADALPHARALRGERVIVDDICVRRDVGNTILEISASPVPPGAFLSIRDITHRKVTEDELARARDEAVRSADVKTEFLANVSHEIRTPLNGVLGSTGLLLGTPLTPEQRDFAELIRSSGETLLSLVNDILDLSRVEAGKLTIETIDFNLDDLLESVIDHFASRAAGKGLKLRQWIPGEIPRMLRGDSHRIRQILLNLVGNAVKFADDGEVVLNIMMPRRSDSSVTLRFLVTDTGPGVDPETQKVLFEPFTQGDGSTTRKYGGSGLGLAVCKQLVEAMNGEIGLMSVRHEGSTFWFDLPLETQPATVTPPARQWDLSPFRALLVDPNEAQRMMVARHLGSTGLEIHEALGAGEARIAAAKDRFDLIVFEMQLPDEDGLAFARSLRLDPMRSATRLLLLTSFGRRRHDLIAFRSAGIDAFVVKPIRRTPLCESAARLLLGDERPEIVVPPEPPPPLHRSDVLVVEDNAVNQLVILGQLERLGHSAVLAANGADALAELSTRRFDVVLMDCQMPGMDGFETTRRIRALAGTRSRVPIIAVTAHALAGERERCLEAGMNDYVAKPVSTEQLGAVIRLWTGTGRDAGEDGNLLTEGDLEVLDREQLGALLSMNRSQEGFLAGLVMRFRQDVPMRLAALRDGVTAGSSKDVALAAHALRSSSGSVGARRLYAIAAQIEASAAREKIAEVSERLETLEIEFNAVLQAYDAIMRRSSGRHKAAGA